MSVNKFIGIGNLTRDPEIRYMQNGDAVANISIACNEKWTDKSGEKKERVEYINIVFYRKLAEIVGEYLKKGAQIYIEGKLQTRKWQDKDTGADRYTTEIIAEQMQMLGGKRDEQSPASSSTAPTAKPAPKSSFDSFDDDAPF